MMKKKQSPDQYKPKAKPLQEVARSTSHPADGMARSILRWLERADTPPSTVLLHGLYLARSPENDGLPIDTLRPTLKPQGTDSKIIRETLEALSIPQAPKLQILSHWLKTAWVSKTPPRDKRTAQASPVRAGQKAKNKPSKSDDRNVSVGRNSSRSTPLRDGAEKQAPVSVVVKKQRKIAK